MQCGIGEFVRHLAAVTLDAKWCLSPVEVLSAEHVVLVLMPTLTPVTLSDIRRLRVRGVARITLDIHHLTGSSSPFAPLFNEVDDVVWHHPRAPTITKRGRYVPLPVPVLPTSSAKRVGGLTHFGLATPHKRHDVMTAVAKELGTILYCYGKRSKDYIPPELSRYAVCEDVFHKDDVLCSRLQRHDVGLIGSSRWSAVSQLNGSASARFFIGAGVPVVLDEAWPHEDLKDVVDVVPFSDFEALTKRVRQLLESEQARSDALERAHRYAERWSPRKVTEEMGICTR